MTVISFEGETQEKVSGTSPHWRPLKEVPVRGVRSAKKKSKPSRVHVQDRLSSRYPSGVDLGGNKAYKNMVEEC